MLWYDIFAIAEITRIDGFSRALNLTMTDDDILPLFGEDYLFALLLRMVLEHCTTMKEGELKSFMLEANADAIRALSDSGFVQITESDGNHVTAVVLPEATALVSRFVTERDSARR